MNTLSTETQNQSHPRGVLHQIQNRTSIFDAFNKIIVDNLVISSFFGLIKGVLGGVASVCWEVSTFWIKVALNGIVVPVQERRSWQSKLDSANTYIEWSQAAAELDRIDGKLDWKENPASSDYDFELIQTRLEQLQKAQDLGDDAAIAFLLRTSLSRNFGGIDNVQLFEQCKLGTKNLIEAFNNKIVDLLQILSSHINDQVNPVELKEKMDFFKDLRHSLGNTALLLSGGASLGVYHAGVMKALQENGLLPRIIAGSSSGAIMAAIACCRSEEEFPSLMRLEGINVHMLEERVPEEFKHSWIYPWSKKLSRFFRHGVVFDGEILKKSLHENIGDITFLEAYRLTNRVLNIAVSSTTMYDMPRLLNYITAPNVLVWSAVVASCALPALFQSAPLIAKDHNGNLVPWNVTGDLWCDGSVENDLPMERLSELFNVNHFIVSQVNPHIYPFVKHAGASPRLRKFNHKVMYLFKSEFNYRLDQISSLGIFPKICKILKGIVSQKYYGDITIIPDISWSDLAHMFVDRPIDAIMESIKRGEKATWPKMSIIQNHLLAELTLDEILLNIRDRLLNLNNSGTTNGGLRSSLASIKSTPSAEYTLEEADDVMLDPTVDLRRHLSPVLSVRSLSNGSLSLAEPSNANDSFSGKNRSLLFHRFPRSPTS